MRISLFTRPAVWALLSIILSILAFADDSPPKHLELGRLLVSQLTPQNTSYQHHGWVRWEGDPSTPHSEAHTDCSGLISSLFERASCSITLLEHVTNRQKRHHPKAEDYFVSITREDGFKRIRKITLVLPGDIIAVKYKVGDSERTPSDSGHVMLVDSMPIRRMNATAPIIPGTQQWEVAVIDSTKSPHGRDDTRYRKSGRKGNGVGRGVFRLYTHEDGTVRGYSWSLLKSSVYYGSSSRPLAVGRVRCNSAEREVNSSPSAR